MPYISEISSSKPSDLGNATAGKVYDILDQLGIPYECVTNDVVETMEECRELDEKLGVQIRKSLFLCDRKKTRFFLVVLPDDKSIKTKELGRKIGVSNPSFAPAEYMEKCLGALPGSASAMGLVNDEGNEVELVIDREVADAEYFGCNAGINTTHLKMKTSDLLERFLPEIHHRPEILEI
ncbi:MAG: prolyl-tRNA synthetase associated domain-containing protein [Mobilibacterium timonense]|uniref:prolyl-tRNA synthetase associated domain-containing protein n=1 Tax=Mobilibacterium timonense TaxID=1871012 RepID=UPI0009855FBD|nr:prolyl-tRNA synthetase associated domain-containing protein [Mobilibacterium timonense]MBM6990957.1 prolyl-tRNA synthetase associated domain-containing protein [Mobilibacterium timonense]